MRVASIRVDDGAGAMAEPIYSESRLFEMNKGAKCGGHFKESRQLPPEERKVAEGSQLVTLDGNVAV